MACRQHNAQGEFILFDHFDLTDLNKEEGTMDPKTLFNRDRIDGSGVFQQGPMEILTLCTTLSEASLHVVTVGDRYLPISKHSGVVRREMIVFREPRMLCCRLGHGWPLVNGVIRVC